MALCPFDDKARPEKEFEQFGGKMTYNNFQVIGVSNEDALVETVTHLLKLARTRAVDILCFPEILGTPKVIECLKELLEEFPGEEEGQYPVLVFCPTKWEERANLSGRD